MLALYALGELRLESATAQVLSRRLKPLVLLTYLARRAPRPASRVELSALLWGERPDAKARQSLRQALLELHRLVGDALIVVGESVALAPGAVSLDAERFEEDVAAGRDAEAIARWKGPFCAGAEDLEEATFRAWADAENAGLERRLRLAFERLLDEAERRGDEHAAIAIARQWTALVPLDEQACLRLITALRREGSAAEALAVHASFVARLREALDVAPSRAFLALARTLDDAARTPPARPVSRVPTPVGTERARHRLVGRSAAFATLTDAWRETRRGCPRVVVLRAERGMGASRLCGDFVRSASDVRPVILAFDGEASPPEGAERFPGASRMLRALGEMPALGGLSPEALSALGVVVPTVTARFPAVPARAQASVVDVALALRDALDAVAEDAPVLLLVDRLDQLDADSRALLLDAVRGSTGGILGLFVVDASESTIGAGEQSLAGAAVASVELLPLSAAQLGELLTASTSLAAADVAPLADALVRETSGIPAYAVALLDAMLDDEVLPGPLALRPRLAIPDPATLAVPEAIHQIVRDRRRAHSADARLVLDAAAVHGQPFDVAGVSHLAGVRPMDAAAAIEQLAVARLIVPTTHDRYTIAPSVVRRAVYERIPALRREALHAADASSKEQERSALAHTSKGAARRPREPAARTGFARRPRVVAGAAAALLIGLAGAAYVLSKPSATTERVPAVAIFPFVVSGDSSIRFLEAGMVDLLSASLDGAAGLRTIDPRVVIATVGAAPRVTPLGIDAARRTAEGLGARYFVLGTVIGVRGRLEVNAALYSTDRGGPPVARASAEGVSEALFDVVDRVTAQIAVAHGTPSGARLARLAAVTTPSLEALKAYLEAQSAYRANDLFGAIPAYQRAVAADSTFALAWYGLASAASWMLRPGLEQHAAAEAVRYAGGLSSRDRTLLAGFAAYSRGEADSAERMAASIAEQYDDIEAWVLLGEVLYHHNWRRGRSATESRRAWERVLALDPRYWPALQHLAEVAALEGDAREADSLLARYERSVGSERATLASRALRAYAFGDDAARAVVEPQLASDRGFWLILSVWYVGVYGRDLDDAQRLARMLVDPLRPPDQQGFGRILLAHLALAKGRWREARAELAIARAHLPAEAQQQELLLSLSPIVATPSGAVDEHRTQLERLAPATAGEPRSSVPWPRPPNSLQPMIRAYLGGMAAARTGNVAAMDRALAQLASMPDPSGVSELAEGFAFSIRAERARALGQRDSALAALERGARATPFVAAWTSGIVAQAYERFLRAELLHELGRDDEALRWYATFAENSPYDLVYLAPALLRQAQIHDARGERRLAADRYARFIDRWSECDDEFRPMLTAARSRLESLRRQP